jgi:hypothetical protein
MFTVGVVYREVSERWFRVEFTVRMLCRVKFRPRGRGIVAY